MAVFGQPLRSETVPRVITLSIDFFERTDSYKLEGIFRVSGTHRDVEVLKTKWDQGLEPDLSVEEPHVVATCLKLFFRDLPVPLLTYELYDCFLAAASVPVSEASLRSVKSVLKLLPKPHFVVIDCLLKMLRNIVQYIQYNKMTPTNLAICFAPSLLRAPPECMDVNVLLEDSKYANKLMEMFIQYYDQLFLCDEVLHSVNNPTPLVQQAPSPPPKPSMPMYIPNKPLPLPPGSRRGSISQSPSVDISRASRSLTVSGDSSAPPVTLGLQKSESAAISSSSSSNRSSLSCSPSNEFQIEAPKFAESLAFKLLHCYPRVSLKAQGLDSYVYFDQEGTLRLGYSLADAGSSFWESTHELFKPMWQDNRISFRNGSKVWIVQDDGTVKVDTRKEKSVTISDESLFEVEFTGQDAFCLKNILSGLFLGYDTLNRIRLVPSDNRLNFQVNLKVALRTNKGLFVTAKAGDEYVCSNSNCMMMNEMLIVQVEDRNSFCSITRFTDQTGPRYWKWTDSKINALASHDDDSPSCYFQAKLFVKREGGPIRIKLFTDSSSSSLPSVVYTSATDAEQLCVGPSSNSPGAVFDMIPFGLKFVEKFRQPGSSE